MDPESVERLRIAETFASLQGEGGLIGTPSFFIRTTGCNLRCEWCDTPYTSWSPEGDWRSVAELVAEIPPELRHVVVTGGEPMLAPALPALTAALRDRGHHVTIETAGTLHQSLACDLMSVSPKLANSDPGPARPDAVREQHRAQRAARGALRRLLADYACQLKFVVGEPADVDDVEGLLAELGPAVRGDVFLMPLGVRRDELAERGRWLAEVCRARGYRFTPRLHIELWGDERGR